MDEASRGFHKLKDIKRVQDVMMIDGRLGGWIQTYTGARFWPLDPRPEEVSITDIAASLSNTCRYSGHTRGFYSVAQHSVLVSRHVKPQNALWGLLHDAGEAYLFDAVRPIKGHIRDIRDIEDRIMRAVCDRFNLPHEMPGDVRQIDEAILTDEKRCLMAPCEYDWGLSHPGIHIDIKPMSPGDAREMFLDRFKELTS